MWVFVVGWFVQHGDTPGDTRFSRLPPTPTVVPLPSMGHRQCCVVGLTREHPDSGGAAIMGVPLPHIVCTPTRATRGEARGHRSVLAQNPLLMYPLLFLPLDWSWSGVSSPDGGLVPITFALLWVHSCRVSFDRASLWTGGLLKGTQRDCFGCVCVVCP